MKKGIILIFISLLLATACGQTGPLVLPADTKNEKPVKPKS
jgi:predicted small lipoprotein YifL